MNLPLSTEQFIELGIRNCFYVRLVSGKELISRLELEGKDTSTIQSWRSYCTIHAADGSRLQVCPDWAHAQIACRKRGVAPARVH